VAAPKDQYDSLKASSSTSYRGFLLTTMARQNGSGRDRPTDPGDRVRRDLACVWGRQQVHQVELHAAGTHAVVERTDMIAVCSPTFYRALERHQARHHRENVGIARGLAADTRPLPGVGACGELLPSPQRQGR
jgi:hypothetical protein